MQWTTDQDLQDALLSIGVTDLISIKFHENRTNGQSKGLVLFLHGVELVTGWLKSHGIHNSNFRAWKVA